MAIVTGAANGIGKAIAEDLSALGARVVVSDVDEAGVQRMASTLPHAWAMRTDVSLVDECDALVATTMEREGRVDILVNDAGLQHVAPIHDFPPDRFEYLLRVMLLGPAMLIRGVLPAMYAAGWGRIVNIGSVNSVVGQPNSRPTSAGVHGTGSTPVREPGEGSAGSGGDDGRVEAEHPGHP